MEQQTQQQTAPPETQQQAPPPEPKAPPLAPAPDRALTLLEKSVDEAVRRQAEGFVLEQCQFSHHQRIARMMYEAGLFDDLKKDKDTGRALSPEEGMARAMVKIELGRTMGIEPFEAMQSIYFVYGRPSLESSVRAAKMKRAGYDWRFLQHDTKGCRLSLMKDGKWLMKPVLDEKGLPVMVERDGRLVMQEEPVVVGFVEADAQRAGLISKKGSLYTVYPRVMYFNRAISEAQKFYAPEVPNGADLPSREEAQEMPQIYTPQEQTVAPTEGTMEAALDIAAQKLKAMQQEPEPDDDTEPVVSEKPKSDKPVAVSANPGTLFQGGLGRK